MKNLGIAICRQDSTSYFEHLSKGLQREILVLPDSKSLDFFLAKEKIQETSFCLVQLNLERTEKRNDGLEIIKYLRLKGLKCIIYCLGYRSKNIINISSPRFSLFRVSTFHKYISLPKSLSFWKKELLQKEARETFMSRYLYQDILQTLVKERSIGQEILHELKNKLLTIENNPDLNDFLNILERPFSLFNSIVPENKEALESIKEKLAEKLLLTWRTNGKQNLISVLDSAKHEILNLLPSQNDENDDSDEEFIPKTRWKVLFMDDEEGVRKYMEKAFRRNKLSYVITKTGEEAIEALEEYKTNKLLTVFISDIRMIENQEEWQRYQGYDVLHTARYDYPYFMRLVALTSGNSRLLKLMNDDSLNIRRALKQDVMGSDSATNVFLKQIREWGNEMYFKSRNQPKSKPWIFGNKSRYKAGFQYYYREHLFSFDYEEEEKKINQNAEGFVSNILENDMMKNEKISFTGTYKNDGPFSVEGLEKFRTIQLTGRKIALALFYLLTQIKEEIYRKMMQIDKNKSVTDNDLKQLFNTSLALSFKSDLPKSEDVKKNDFLSSNLLEEEIFWLKNKYDVNFDIEKIRLDEDDKLSVFEIIDELQNKISKEDGFYPELEKLKKKKFSTFLESKNILNRTIKISERLDKKEILLKIIKVELEDNMINNQDLVTFLRSIN